MNIPAPSSQPPADAVESPHPPRRPRWVRRHPVATGLLVLLTIIALGVVGAGLWLRHSLSSISTLADPFATLPTRAPAAVTTAQEDPVTILVLGSDSRLDTTDPHTWKAGAQRTDSIMLVQVSGDRRHVNVMSIPRDSWVTIAANSVVDHPSQAKINAAYSWGGPTLLIETIESTTGIHIDHCAVASFGSFQQLTDTLGGVDLTLTRPLTVDGQTLPAGTQHLNGAQALAYARERYNLPHGDFDRMKRQQAWMRAIAAKAMSKDVLSDPTQLAGLVSTVSAAVSTDESLDAAELTRLGQSLATSSGTEVTYFQAPVTGTSTSPDGQSIVVLDMTTLAAVSHGFQTDNLASVVTTYKDRLNVLGDQVE